MNIRENKARERKEEKDMETGESKKLPQGKVYKNAIKKNFLN